MAFREIINLDEVKIGAYLKGKSVLVTGAGGSIGSELSRQICRFKLMRISLYDRTESYLYEIDLVIKQNYPNVEILALLANTRDRNQIDKAFQFSKPQVIFHAAAYKHVPILGRQPSKAEKITSRGRVI
jgi:FlaA1/EpsC-like NDP-sugar epimerase